VVILVGVMVAGCGSGGGGGSELDPTPEKIDGTLAARASVRHFASIRTVVARLAEGAALREQASFSHSWHILMKGSIVSATEGDAQAAQRARSMARLLIEQHR
jgi:hypothetical protein